MFFSPPFRKARDRVDRAIRLDLSLKVPGDGTCRAYQQPADTSTLSAADVPTESSPIMRVSAASVPSAASAAAKKSLAGLPRTTGSMPVAR